MWNSVTQIALLEQHLLNNNLNHREDRPIKYFPKGPAEPSVKLLDFTSDLRDEKFKKNIIFDLDNTINRYKTRPPTMLFLDYVSLPEKNFYLNQKKSRLEYDIKMIETADYPKVYVDDISFLFREAKLTEELYLEAAKYAGENFSIAPNLNKAIDYLKKMGYIISILSASPYEVVESCSKRIRINMRHVKASEFYFDSRGIFDRMNLNIGEMRARNRDLLMDRLVRAKYNIEIMVDDNPITGKRIANEGPNHIYFWLSDQKPILRNISLSMPELRHDFLQLVYKVMMLERAIAISLTMSEESYRAVHKLAHLALNYGRKALSCFEDEFNFYKEKFVETSNEYMDTMRYYPAKTSGIKNRIRRLENQDNRYIAKPDLREIVKDFYNTSVEAQIPLPLTS